MPEELEAVPVSGVVELAATVAHLVEQQREYFEACNRLLDKSDYQDIGDKSFRKKSGWRKLAIAFNVSTDVMEERFTEDARGRIIRAKYTVRATAPNGRHADGVGLCAAWERCCDPTTCKLQEFWKDSGKPTGHIHCGPDCDGRHAFTKPDHDIPATAMTRASNRACSDLFGLGEVSAEEVEAEPAGRTYGTGTPPPAQSPPIVAAGRQPVGTTRVLARVANLDTVERALFDKHVAEMNWPWPPTAGAVIKAAEKYLDTLEEAGGD